jgi:hypothetical protein
MFVRVWPIALLGLLSSAALAKPPAQLTLCLDRPRSERTFAAQLQQWLPVRLALAPRETCPGGVRTAYCGWFERRGAAVDFVLSGTGVQRRRQIPWLRRRGRPLASLNARGHLPAFSVMLHALIAEHRLRWLLDDPPELARRRGAPPVEEQIARDAEKPRGAWRRQGLFAATLVALTTAPRPGRAKKRTCRPGHAQLRSLLASSRRPRRGNGDDVVGRAPPAATAPAIASAPASAPAPATVPATGHAARGAAGNDDPGADALFAPVAEHPERAAIERPVRPAALPLRVIETHVATGSAREPRTDAAVTARTGRPFYLTSLLTDLSLEAQLAFRWRSGDLFAQEAGGCLGWRRLFLRAAYQPAAQWDLAGRPVRVTAVPLAAGWRPSLWTRSVWRLSLQTAVLVERFNLRRLDVPDIDHIHWDAGLAAGLGLDLRIFRGLGLGLVASGFWFPDAKQIEVRNGPSARFTRFGGRLALAIFWGAEGSIPASDDISQGEPGISATGLSH